MSKFHDLKCRFEAQGWNVTSIELRSDCWWAKDIWCLKSLWSPVGFDVYAVFLLDPMDEFDENNPPENSVYAVGLYQDIPADRPMSDTEIFVHKNLKTGFQQIIQLAQTLRDHQLENETPPDESTLPK